MNPIAEGFVKLVDELVERYSLKELVKGGGHYYSMNDLQEYLAKHGCKMEAPTDRPDNSDYSEVCGSGFGGKNNLYIQYEKSGNKLRKFAITEKDGLEIEPEGSRINIKDAGNPMWSGRGNGLSIYYDENGDLKSLVIPERNFVLPKPDQQA